MPGKSSHGVESKRSNTPSAMRPQYGRRSSSKRRKTRDGATGGPASGEFFSRPGASAIGADFGTFATPLARLKRGSSRTRPSRFYMCGGRFVPAETERDDQRRRRPAP